MSDSKISVNLGEKAIHVAKARESGGKVEVELLGYQQDTPPFFDLDTEKIIEDVAKILKKMVDNLKIGKRPVNVVIPDAFTYSQIVTMPKLKEKELLSAIKYQADQFIPMPIDETSLDLEILHENKAENKLLVLIVAAPQSLIEKVERVTESSGLFPELIENELSASARFVSTCFQPKTQETGTIFINLGYSSTSFYFYHHGLKLIVDNHTFETGLSLFLREAQADANIDPLKAKNLLKDVGFSKQSSIDLGQILKPTVDVFSSELQKFIISVKAKFKIASIEHLYMYNLTSEILGIEKKIESAISLPTSLYNPLDCIKQTRTIEPFTKDIPSFIPAIGGSLQ